MERHAKAESMNPDHKPARVSDGTSQKARKGTWRMPWLSEAMKDVISCDKPRGGANIP